MANEMRSVFLHGKPTQKKLAPILKTQKVYTELINVYIEKLISDPLFYLDLFNNNKKSSKIRDLEKQTRKSSKIYTTLGSAYGQNAIDHAVKELYNHFTRIKNKMYGYFINKREELLPYVESIGLLNAAILDLDEEAVLNTLISFENAKKKPSESKLSFYQELQEKINLFSKKERKNNKQEVRIYFYDMLDAHKTPFVNKASVQLDGRLFKLEKANHIQADYVISFKAFGEKDYIKIPLIGSKNGLRRLSQYKNGNPVFTLKNNQLKVSVPFEKKIKSSKSKNVVGADIGITDLIYSSEGKNYGTFSGMNDLYEKVLEPKLKQRSRLRNVMRDHQKELRKGNLSENRKNWLRTKISNIANMLNQKKQLEKCKRKYAHAVDVRLNTAIKPFINDMKINKSMVSMESLDITTFDRGKKNNKRDSSWVRGQLTKKIQEKLIWNGIPFVEVDPAYTSKVCPECFNIDDENRNFKRFVCTVCKHTDDADHNASINIKNRATDKELFEITEKHRFSTKKRHTAIKELYALRHHNWLEKNTVVLV